MPAAAVSVLTILSMKKVQHSLTRMMYLKICDINVSNQNAVKADNATFRYKYMYHGVQIQIYSYRSLYLTRIRQILLTTEYIELLDCTQKILNIISLT